MLGGLNCNLMNGRKTGSGAIAEDNWAKTIEVLRARGWLPKRVEKGGGEIGNEDGNEDGNDGLSSKENGVPDEIGSFIAAHME